MSNFERDEYCFACGKKNPIGLKLEITESNEGEAIAKFVARKEYQGFKDILHGGIIATILDEVMVWASFLAGYYVATAKLEIKYKKPAPIGKELIATGKITKVEGKKVFGKATLVMDNIVLAEARSLMIIVKEKENREW